MAEQYYAIIQNGVVQNVIVADDDFIAANFPGSPRIDTLTPVPGIGWTYANGTFTPPTQTPPAPQPQTDFTPYGFMCLFALAELKAIYTADSNTGLTSDQQAQVKVIMAEFEAAQDISLLDPATQNAVNYMATPQPNGPGLLTAARAAAILSGQPPQ